MCLRDTLKCIINKNTTNIIFSSVVPKVGGEAEMGGWGTIGDPLNNYISVVLLTLSDQMS